MSQSAPILAYGHADRRKTRRRIFGVVTLAFLALAIAYIWWNHGQRIRSQVAYLHWQRQCANYYVETIGPAPACWRSLWNTLILSYSGPPYIDQTIFLGERESIGGQRFILHLELRTAPPSVNRQAIPIQIQLVSSARRRCGWFEDYRKLRSTRDSRPMYLYAEAGESLVARRDPGDPSHLTMQFRGYKARDQGRILTPADIDIDIYIADSGKLQYMTRFNTTGEEIELIELIKRTTGRNEPRQ